ncbi:unnamed protein product [Malus baccata var. baccata]
MKWCLARLILSSHKTVPVGDSKSQISNGTKEKTETKFSAIKTNKCWSILKKVGLCTFEEYMEKESIDHGVESDGNMVEKDKMLHEKISELNDEICSNELS